MAEKGTTEGPVLRCRNHTHTHTLISLPSTKRLLTLIPHSLLLAWVRLKVVILNSTLCAMVSYFNIVLYMPIESVLNSGDGVRGEKASSFF